MSINAVRPLVVTPKHDSQGQTRRDNQHHGQEQRPKDEPDGFASTLRNALGQAIGQTINLTA